MEVGDLLVFAAHAGDVTSNSFSGLFALVTKHAIPPLLILVSCSTVFLGTCPHYISLNNKAPLASLNVIIADLREKVLSTGVAFFYNQNSGYFLVFGMLLTIKAMASMTQAPRAAGITT